MDFKCPSCSGANYVYIGRGERHYVRCSDCGQIQLLPVRPLLPRLANVIDLFPDIPATN